MAEMNEFSFNTRKTIYPDETAATEKLHSSRIDITIVPEQAV